MAVADGCSVLDGAGEVVTDGPSVVAGSEVAVGAAVGSTVSAVGAMVGSAGGGVVEVSVADSPPQASSVATNMSATEPMVNHRILCNLIYSHFSSASVC